MKCIIFSSDKWDERDSLPIIWLKAPELRAKGPKENIETKARGLPYWAMIAEDDGWWAALNLGNSL